MWLRDSGVLNKLKEDVQRLPRDVHDAKVRANQPLTLSHLGFRMMILLAVGLLLSSLAFVGEHLWHKPDHGVQGGAAGFDTEKGEELSSSIAQLAGQAAWLLLGFPPFPLLIQGPTTALPCNAVELVDLEEESVECQNSSIKGPGFWSKGCGKTVRVTS